MFNVVIDENVVLKTNTVTMSKRRYKMGIREIRTLCYSGAATLIADNKNDFKNMLCEFHMACEQILLTISTSNINVLMKARN